MIDTSRSNNRAKLAAQIAIWMVILLVGWMTVQDLITQAAIHKLLFDGALVLYFTVKARGIHKW